MPRVGEPIRLNLQLSDGATNKYPRVYLYDKDDVELDESPVDLTHAANGLYTDDSVDMPSTNQVKAIYKVFSDSGHSTLDTDYCNALDLFNLEFSDCGANLVGVVGIDELTGTVEEC